LEHILIVLGLSSIYQSKNLSKPSSLLWSFLCLVAATLFWTGRWIFGQSIADLAPQVMTLVSTRKRNRQTVLEALTDRVIMPGCTTFMVPCLLSAVFFSEYFPFGTSSLKLFYSSTTRCGRLKFRGSLVTAIIHKNRPPTKACFRVLFYLVHMKEFGNLGHPASVISSYG
jgi:hypothetical protein